MSIIAAGVDRSPRDQGSGVRLTGSFREPCLGVDLSFQGSGEAVEHSADMFTPLCEGARILVRAKAQAHRNMKMRRQLRFGAEGDVDMIQECSWCLPAMTFRDVGRNRRCASFDLCNDSEPFRWRKGAGKLVTVDHEVHGLSPHCQIPKALHVECAHAEPPGKKLNHAGAGVRCL